MFNNFNGTQGNIKNDVLSGITVALALVPEAVAFAQANAEDPSIDAETLCARAVSLAFARRYR